MAAWIALVIAGASLSWNIISTIRAWLKARIKVVLAFMVHEGSSTDSKGTTVWLRVTAMNRGGSPVAVTAIGVKLTERTQWRNEPSPTYPHPTPGIVGPDVPNTIEVNHLASRHLDLSNVVGNGLREKGKAMYPYVELSDGTVVENRYVINEWKRKRALDIFERRVKERKQKKVPKGSSQDSELNVGGT
jgi:hypothetical protein